MHEGSKKAIVAAFLANLGIAIGKLIGFVFTGAASMLAESIHSMADTANQGLLILGGKRARRPPDVTHPFGYGKVRYFWSFVVALVLFSLGGLFAIYEAIEKLRHPHELESPVWAFAILGAAIALESFSFRTAVREAKPLRRGRSWPAFVRESKAPELPVVLLEDLGALFGLCFALMGVTLAVVTDEPRFDAVGSLAIGVLLVAIAWVLAVEMKSLLIGEAASSEDDAAIRAALEQGGAARVIHVRTEHLGPEDLLVAAKVELVGVSTVPELADAIDAAEARVRAAIEHRAIIYIEPDLYEARSQADPPSEG